MNRVLSLVVCLVVALQGCATVQTNWTGIAAETQINNTVIVESRDKIGSGVLFRSHGALYVLTAAHVIRDEVEPIVVSGDSNPNKIEQPMATYHSDAPVLISWFDPRLTIRSETSARVAFFDPATDILVLKMESETGFERFHGVEFETALTTGERVFTVGHPLNELYCLSQGIVCHHHRYITTLPLDPLSIPRLMGQCPNPLEPWYIETDATGGPGSSGGGLFSVGSGRCLGIVVLLGADSRHLYAVPMARIIAALAASEEGKNILPFP